MIPDSPFAPDGPRQSFLEICEAGEALRRLEHGLGVREPFLLVTGEPGTGKTALAHEAIARWESRVTVAFLAYPALTGGELLEEIVLRFGGQPADGASRPKLVACLERSLADIAGSGRVAMIVVDDAHRLAPELLEELRLLVNAARQAGQPLEVLLLGLPSLETGLDEPALAALRQRISVRARLEPLSEGETRRYLRHRAGAAGGDGASLFPRRTCADIAALSGGVPRRINALAAAALRLARESGEATVQPQHVTAAAAELSGVMPARGADDPDGDDRESAPKTLAPPRARARSTEPAAGAAPAPHTRAMPASAGANAPRITPAAAPMPAPPTSHDAREWVSRFVGDRGPVQIGSQVASRSRGTTDTPASAPAPSPGSAESPRPPAGASAGARSRSRSRRGRGLRAASAVVLVTSVVIAAVVLVIRAGGLAPKRAHPGAATTAASAPRGAGPVPAPAVPVAVTRAPAARPPASEGGPPEDVAAVSPNGRYTLDVGGYPDLQACLDERDRLQELTGIEGWVIPSPEGAAGPPRIVLGIYRSRERAVAAAHMLVSSQTLGQVAVVPLPPRGSRL